MNYPVRPLATCRLQFSGQFRFEDARALVPYLARLGITHLYSSPILRSRGGGTHGYDVVDPTNLNPDVGSEADFRNLVQTLHAHAMGMVLDIVPNHMAASGENPYWQHVLTYGLASPYARWFDIDWRISDPELWGRVVVPVLGAPLPQVVDDGQIALRWHEGRFRVAYYDHVFPVDPATVPDLLRFGLGELSQQIGEDHPSLAELNRILKFLRKVPRRAMRGRTKKEVPLADIEDAQSRLAVLVESSPTIREWAARTAATFGEGEEGHARLKKFLNAQSYRLAHWRRAARILNYRRFFDINDLISLRQEDPEVFDGTHALVLRWVHEGLLDGLRIDHLDGLRDPLGYLERLAQAVAANGDRRRDVPIFVEKILGPDEHLPTKWPVAGTTGYEFANQCEAVFVSPEGFHEIEEFYRQLLRRNVQFRKIVIGGKQRVLKNELSAFVGRLAEIALRLAQNRPETSSLAHRDLVDALVEIVVSLPVYRTYIEFKRPEIDEHDRRWIEHALADARERASHLTREIDFLGHILLLAPQPDVTEHEQRERLGFIERFQQLTGPAAAKGVEDTALYAYVPLVSLNEVGGEPHLPDDPVQHLHNANAERAVHWPRCMLGVTTHDTKRTADVRSRLDVLSEIPKIWFAYVQRWRRWNEPHRRTVKDKTAPDPATEYLLYQTLVGIWPAAPNGESNGSLPDEAQLNELRERAEQYMLKAVREAKTRTSWVDPDPEFEEAVTRFLAEILAPSSGHPSRFVADLNQFVARVARPGFWNALARTLIHYTAPGTPDLYQGDEIWNFALVDPDNRRPVDFELRSRLLDEIAAGIELPDERRRAFLAGLVDAPEDGRIKLHVVRTALHARRDHPALFATGTYEPLTVTGSRAKHLVAYARRAGEEALLVAVPRLTTTPAQDIGAPPIGAAFWGDTAVQLPEDLHGRSWRSALTAEPLSFGGDAGGGLPAAQLFSSFPVALLLADRRNGAAG